MRPINGMAALVEKGFHRRRLASVQETLCPAYIDAVGINVGFWRDNESQVQRRVHLVLSEDVN